MCAFFDSVNTQHGVSGAIYTYIEILSNHVGLKFFT